MAGIPAQAAGEAEAKPAARRTRKATATAEAAGVDVAEAKPRVRRTRKAAATPEAAES